MPPLDVVRALQGRLDDAGIVSAVGGSGLLRALSLVDAVHDWDVTVRARPEMIVAVLESMGLPFERMPPGGMFATEALYRVAGPDHEIDVLCGFALHAGARVVRIPTRPWGRWRGLVMSEPRPWELAYRLMGRHERSDRLRRARLAGAELSELSELPPAVLAVD